MKNKKLTAKEKEAYAIVGRLGGLATAKKLRRKGMSELGKKAAKVRWGKKLKANKK